MLNASKIPANTSNRERPDPLEPGTYPARVSQIICIGLQKNQYDGEEKEPVLKLLVVYELLDEFMKDEDGNEDTTAPRVVSEDFPLYSIESDLAKSTKRYLALDPKLEHGGNWAELAGTPCMVTIVNKKSKKNPDVVYDNVSSVSGMREKDAAKAPDAVLDTKVFDPDEPDMEVYWSIWRWIRKRIEENIDFEGSVLEQAIKDNPEPERETDSKVDKEEKKPAKKSRKQVKEETEEEEDW